MKADMGRMGKVSGIMVIRRRIVADYLSKESGVNEPIERSANKELDSVHQRAYPAMHAASITRVFPRIAIHAVKARIIDTLLRLIGALLRRVLLIWRAPPTFPPLSSIVIGYL